MKLRLFTAIAVTAMAMISCSEDTDTIGSSITNDADRLVYSTGVYKATSKSILADSVYSHNSDYYFGMVKDPETKSYVKSGFMAQFNMIEGFSLPSKDSMLSLVDGEVAADSCEISLFVRYSKSYGDTLTAMKMRLTELDTPIDEAYTYYSNFDLKSNGYLRNDGLKINKMFTVRDLKLSDGTLWSIQNNIQYQGTSSDSGYYDRIRIPMNIPYTSKEGKTYNNYGTYLLRTYYEHPEYFKNSYWFVHKVCPGFNFEITDGLGLMANIMEVDIQAFYRYKNDTTSYTSSVYLTSTPEVIQTQYIQNDRTALEQLVNDNSCTYIKSPAGVYTEVTLPVDEISQAHANDSLLSVSVDFCRQNSSVKGDDYQISTPTNILMVHKDSLYSFFENQTMYDYKSSFMATLSKNVYSFSNIGNMITLMAKQKEDGLKSDPNWVANHPDWNKVVLVPISTTVQYSTSYYTGTTSTITGVGNQMGLTSTKLVGGTDTPFEVKVIYAKFKE